MSLPEVMFRVYRFAFQRFEQLFVLGGWKPSLNFNVKHRNALFGYDAKLIDEWSNYFQLDRSGLGDYMSGKINFFGHNSLDIGNPVAWKREPITKVESPDIFGKVLNYRNDKIVGNVKFIWELGRHQHLVPLTVAYVVSGDISYRDEVIKQIDSWIEQNPFGIGIHWCSSLEVSLRLISWSVVHSLLVLKGNSEGLFGLVKDKQQLGDSIYQQAYYVRKFLSRYSSANNHLMGELSGLWVTCQVFDLGEKGLDWAAFAYCELESESRKQVHSDGVGKEQAFYYHLWVLEYLFFVWMVGVRTGQEFSKEFYERILMMVKFLKDVSHDKGEPPQFGDSDDGFVTRFEPVWSKQPFLDFLDVIDYVIGNTATPKNHKAFWYKSIIRSTLKDPPAFSWQRFYPEVYTQGGYVVMGGNGCHIVFDVGPLGYLGIAAHGHADALSFCMAVDNEWWLIDPGTYVYHSNPEWRSYFRSTAGHNTVRVNEEDQSQIAGPFMWHRKAVAYIDKFENKYENQKVLASHDGYLHLGITHSREMRFSPVIGQLDIIDKLIGNKSAEIAEIYFHFAPNVKVEWNSIEQSWVATKQGRKKKLYIYTDLSWKFKVVKGNINPKLGWYSPVLEEKVPTCTLYGRFESGVLGNCVTRILVV
jgi:hypothetical protein